MNSRLTLHFQSLPGWSREFCERALRNGGEMYTKAMDVSEDNPFEGLPVRTIGRMHIDDDISNAWAAQGEKGAHLFFERVAPLWDKRRWVWRWCLGNEPQPMQELWFVNALHDHLLKLVELAHAEGFKVAGPELGNGWPFVGLPDERYPGDPGVSDVPVLACALAAMDLLTVHEYSWPTLYEKETYHCLRYRRLVQQMVELGYPVPPLGVTEHGLDRLAADFEAGPQGWRGHVDWDSYLGQMAWYDQRLAEDNVLCATIFTAGPNDPWHSYGIDQEEAWRLADYIAMYPPAWEPEPATPHVPTPPAPLPTFTPPIVSMISKLPTYAKVSSDKKLQLFRHREVDDIKRVVVHHSAGMQRPPGDIRRWIRRVARWQIRKYGWEGFAYHAVVDADGVLYLTNDATTVTHHSGNWWANDTSLGLLLLGDNRHGHDTPTDAQLATAKWYVQKTGKRVRPHKRIVATACPGDLRAGWWKELRRAWK